MDRQIATREEPRPQRLDAILDDALAGVSTAVRMLQIALGQEAVKDEGGLVRGVRDPATVVRLAAELRSIAVAAQACAAIERAGEQGSLGAGIVGIVEAERDRERRLGADYFDAEFIARDGGPLVLPAPSKRNGTNGTGRNGAGS